MKVTKDTIARTIILVLALLNQVLAIMGKGHIDIAENDIYQMVTLVATIATAIIAWWKNNSFTTEALRADVLMKNLKEDKKAVEK